MRTEPEQPLYSLKNELLPSSALVIGIIKEFSRVVAYTNRIKPEFNPVNLNLDVEIRYYRDILFEILLAKARQRNLPFISIASQDLIAPNTQTKLTKREELLLRPSHKLSAWGIVAEMELPGSCGNGVGATGSQYQIYGTTYFANDHMGIWDPENGTKIANTPLTLHNASEIFIDRLDKLKSKKSIHQALIDTEEYRLNYKRERH